jgi:hypothetical protein
VLREGSRLDQGATYVDLHSEHPEEFTALADMVALGDNWLVPKSRIDYTPWNRLLGVTDPARVTGTERA